MITHAFTCTGPYVLLIMLGIKRVENRDVYCFRMNALISALITWKKRNEKFS
jgi:hypothetical protein